MLISGLLHAGLALCSPLVTTRDISLPDAETVFTNLQQWYDSSTGLWQGMWWHSGSILSTICNLATISPNLKSQITQIISTSYTSASAYTYSSKSSQGFIGDFYDDEAWWALGFISAYDLTGNTQYLNTAETIFQDMYQTFGQTTCSNNSGGQGGIWWDKSHTYINSIANELFLALATSLSTRVHSSDYAAIAQQQWSWFRASGLIRQDNLNVDGLLSNCSAQRPGTIWSYNQGVLLPALVTLSETSIAHDIASATMSNLAPNGILQDPCEQNTTAGGINTCDGDQTQFKGIFVRGLDELQKASPRDEYADFLGRNAESMWNTDQENGLLSVHWGGPFVSPANASTQSSGLDLINAALGS